MDFCEHCGPVRYAYEDGGTSWCKYCMDANGLMCAKHPKYKAKRKPTARCMTCKHLWDAAEEKRRFLSQ